MLSKVKTISLFGLEGKLIEVQTDIGNGIPEFDIVGLPDTSLKEAKKRIEKKPKTRFSLTEEQEKKQILIQIRTVLMEQPEK